MAGRAINPNWGLNDKQIHQLKALRRVKDVLKSGKTTAELKRIPVERFLTDCGKELFGGRPLVACDPLSPGDCPSQEAIAEQPYAQTYTVKKLKGQRKVLQCIPPDLVGTGTAEQDQALYRRFLRALALIEHEGDKYEQLAAWKFGAGGDGVTCKKLQTRGQCLAVPLSRTDQARRCKFEPYARDPVTGISTAAKPDENDPDGPVKNPRSTDAGECTPASYTQAITINRNAKRVLYIDSQIKGLAAKIQSTAFDPVRGQTSANVAPKYKDLMVSLNAHKRKLALLRLERTHLDMSINKEFNSYKENATKQRLQSTVDSICRSRTDPSSTQDMCDNKDGLCQVIDPMEGPLADVDDSTTMGDSMCLSADGKGTTWDWGGKDNPKVIMRDGTVGYRGKHVRNNLQDYWSYAREKLGHFVGTSDSKETQETIDRLNETIEDMTNKILVLGVQIKAAKAKGNTEQAEALTKERGTYVKRYTVLAKRASKSPVLKDQLTNYLSNMTFSDKTKESSEAILKAAAEGGIPVSSLVLTQLHAICKKGLENADGTLKENTNVVVNQILLIKLKDLLKSPYMLNMFKMDGETQVRVKVLSSVNNNVTVELKDNTFLSTSVKPTVTKDLCRFATGHPPTLDATSPEESVVLSNSKTDELKTIIDVTAVSKFRKLFPTTVAKDVYKTILAGASVVLIADQPKYESQYLTSLVAYIKNDDNFEHRDADGKWIDGPEKDARLVTKITDKLYAQEEYFSEYVPDVPSMVSGISSLNQDLSLLSTEIPGKPPRMHRDLSLLSTELPLHLDLSLLSTEIPGVPPRMHRDPSLLSTELPGVPQRMHRDLSLLSTELPGVPPRMHRDMSMLSVELPHRRDSYEDPDVPPPDQVATDVSTEFNVEDYYNQMYGNGDFFDSASVSQLP